MLRQLVILAVLAIGTTMAFYYTEKTTDKEYLMKQQKIYNLLYHVSQSNIVVPEFYKEGQAYDIKANIDSYTNKEAVENFLHRYEHGFLPRGEICSMYYEKHIKEMMALFRLFFYAKDFDTFYKTAQWGRVYMNECQFVFAMYLAVIRRPDTMYLQLPFPYEMYPYVYFNSEVMEKAHHAKFFGKLESKTGSGFDTYIIPANYSGWYLTREYSTESKLNYFTEDIGLNSYYFYFRMEYPFFLNTKEFGLPEGYRGEEYLYGHKQLFNRYLLERFSNDMDKVEDFDWHEPFHSGYYPSMTYHNGLPFPQRPYWSRIPYYKFKYVKDIENYETRISNAIDSGYAFCDERFNIYEKEDGLNILGNLIEGNADSCNWDFYGSIDVFGRKILGFNLDTQNPYQIYPSALEYLSSSMRDPAFYRLYKRITDYYFRFKSHEKPYKQEEIVFPQFKIESVVVDKLQTYFDQFDASIHNGLLVESQKEADSMFVKARQFRLNHKPFNFHMSINAEKASKAAIRIFLGPKYDSRHKLLNFFDKYMYFYEIDNYIINLNAGMNKIERSSHDFYFLIDDQEPAEFYFRKVLKALESGETFKYQERIFGFPQRLLLPKGKREGMPFQFFIYVSPVDKEETYQSRIFGSYTFDDKNYGFPLDRPLNELEFHGPNMFFKEVFIYHKDEYDINMTY